jgi:hypothetical protein
MSPAATLRPRTLSALGSPFAPSTDDATWRTGVPSLGVSARLRGRRHLTHNSIPAALCAALIQMADVPPADSGSVFGATEQAAPPRGVPR